MQQGVVIWVTGLPSSGKSEFGARLFKRLQVLGIPTCVLDDDRVRECLEPAPPRDAQGRGALYETLARLSALLANEGLVVVVPANAGRRSARENARRRAPRFIEVLLPPPDPTSPDTGRAPHAQGGEALADDVFEPPIDPEIVARSADDVDAMTDVISALGRICPSER